MSQLLADRIIAPWQVEIMRQIYNHCLPHLATKPLTEVDELQQQRWWEEIRTRASAHLYRPEQEPWKFVAFSLVQVKAGGVKTPLFGIIESHRGRGYGAEIIRHYLSVANGPLAGEALVSNHAIMELNRRAGWELLASDGKIAKLYHPGPFPRDEEIYAEILHYHGIR